MTIEQVIQRRLSMGATFRPDGAGITMELPGQPTSWTRRDLWDAATGGLVEALGQSGVVAATPTAEKPSNDLVAFLGLAGFRA